MKQQASRRILQMKENAFFSKTCQKPQNTLRYTGYNSYMKMNTIIYTRRGRGGEENATKEVRDGRYTWKKYMEEVGYKVHKVNSKYRR